MIRKLLLAVAFALPVMAFAGTGMFVGGVAHAAGVGGSIPVPAGCADGNYSPLYSGPYYLDGCYVGENDGPTSTDTDDNYGAQNWASSASFSGLGCIAASIVNGQDYYNPTGWVEFDTYNPFNDTYTVHSHCTVQTGDTGITHNLFAYLYDSECDLQLFGDYALYGSASDQLVGQILYGSTQLYEAESPNGTVTLSCNATSYAVP